MTIAVKLRDYKMEASVSEVPSAIAALVAAADEFQMQVQRFCSSEKELLRQVDHLAHDSKIC